MPCCCQEGARIEEVRNYKIIYHKGGTKVTQFGLIHAVRTIWALVYFNLSYVLYY